MTLRITPIMCAAALIAVGAIKVSAQDAPTLKVEIARNVEPTPIPTPQIQVTNIPDKRWKPKNWLELDIPFDVKKAKVAGDTSSVVDALDFKIYIALNRQDPVTHKYPLLTANITYVNVPIKEKVHALAFVSPSALSRALDVGGNKAAEFTKNDIKAVAIEVSSGGQLVGGYTSIPVANGKKWWEATEGFNSMDGMLIPKTKTPFSILWGDYDVEVKP
jgi:hypothetical protein